MAQDAYDINIDSDGNIIPNERDSRQVAFWIIATSWMMTKYTYVIDAMAFGKDSKNFLVFNVVEELSLFLDGIYQKIQMDMSDGRAYLGDDYYFALYCIPRMKNRLLCLGVPSKTIDDLFGVYFGGVTSITPAGQLDGIGYMIISNDFIIA